MDRRERKEVVGGYSQDFISQIESVSLGRSDRGKENDIQTLSETKREGRW